MEANLDTNAEMASDLVGMDEDGFMISMLDLISATSLACLNLVVPG